MSKRFTTIHLIKSHSIPFRLITLLLLVLLIFPTTSTGQIEDDFVGSKVCADCHYEEYSSWESSHHAWAWKLASQDSVLGNFGNVEFSHQGITTRFFQNDDGFWIETDGPDDTRLTYNIKYTVGVEPLQQYLIETEGGRLQTLDIAWNTEAARWFMVFPNHPNNVPGDALHWTGVYKNWNGRCAECHATDFQKGYDARLNVFDTKWSEVGVGCESCHGPASTHVNWAYLQGDAIQEIREYLTLSEMGLANTTIPDGQDAELSMCASCHTRRTSLTGDSPPHGENFSEFYDLALLRPDLYFPDGQIKDEVYILGSFMQSKMYAAGVQCTDCHNAHSAKIKISGNGLCTQCHSLAGNNRFPQLKQANYDEFQHMRHEAGTPGGQCVDCHMPERVYMEVDPRRDHRFGIPSPQDSLDLGVPNTCNACHEDRDALWAIEQLASWTLNGAQPVSQFGWIFHRLEEEPTHPDNLSDLMALIDGASIAPIVRATALERLIPYARELDWKKLLELVPTGTAEERIATIKLFANAPPGQGLPILAKALTDEMRSVRIAAAQSLLHIPETQMPESVRVDMRNAAAEMFKSLEVNSDHPNTRLGMAGVALSLRNTDAALASVHTALDIDPKLENAWIMRARIEQALMRPDLIEKTMQDANLNHPNSAVLLNYFGNYLFGQRRYKEAMRKLSKAYVLSGGNITYGLDYVRLLLAEQDSDKALEILYRILKDSSDNIDALVLLARSYQMEGESQKRDQTISRLRILSPKIQLPDDLSDERGSASEPVE